jgi:Mat/Ecp fimbriae major subunit
MKKIFTALALSAIPLTAAHAQSTATATGSVGATFIQPLAITHDTGATINFGQVMASSSNGKLDVDLNGSTAGTNGAVTFFKGSTASADAFTVTGEPNKAITLTFPWNFKMTGPNAAEVVVWPNYKETTATLSSTGTYQFKVGAYVSVSSSYPAGKYSGTYSVTVSYN